MEYNIKGYTKKKFEEKLQERVDLAISIVKEIEDGEDFIQCFVKAEDWDKWNIQFLKNTINGLWTHQEVKVYFRYKIAEDTHRNLRNSILEKTKPLIDLKKLTEFFDYSNGQEQMLNNKPEGDSDTTKIFISHSSSDKEYGELIVELLRNIGLKEDKIIFTSNVAYGIPVSENIFNWLKSQIEKKPFVIYLLSQQYYKSIACLNEMGAAWIIENDHATIFTPDFNIESKEFQSGALDPREIGFYINNEERVLSFIELLSNSFEISNKPLIITQSVKKFIDGINKIKPSVLKSTPTSKKEERVLETLQAQEKPSPPKIEKRSKPEIKGDLYSKFLDLIAQDKLQTNELILIHYIIQTSRVNLMIGWQEENEITNIKEWENLNEIKDILSTNYASTLRRFELRGFTEISAVTSSGNPKEIALKTPIASNILDLPTEAIDKVEDVIKSNYFEYEDEFKREYPF